MREGDQRREAGVAVDELPGAVDRVDDPYGCVAAEGGEHGRIGVHRLLAHHHGAGQQLGESVGQMLLGLPVGDGHQVVRALLLHDLVGGELPVARHDLVGDRRADRLLHRAEITGEKFIDHAFIESCLSDGRWHSGCQTMSSR